MRFGIRNSDRRDLNPGDSERLPARLFGRPLALILAWLLMRLPTSRVGRPAARPARLPARLRPNARRRLPAAALPLFAAAFLVATPAAAELARNGDFSHDPALPHVLVFRGEIDRETITDFRAATAGRAITLVFLDSPGGRIHASLDLAARFRATGLDTLVPAGSECASACAFVFLAGVRRQAEGKLGVHRFTSEDRRRASVARIEEDTQETVAEIIAGMSALGAPPIFLQRMFETANSGMYWFGADELRDTGMVTGEDFGTDQAAWEGLRLAEEESARAAAAPPAGLPPSGQPAVIGPGFDCATVTGQATEEAICADARLSTLDRALSKRIERLGRRMATFDALRLKAEGLVWLQKRNACGGQADCIETVYLERLEELGY